MRYFAMAVRNFLECPIFRKEMIKEFCPKMVCPKRIRLKFFTFNEFKSNDLFIGS